MTELAGTKERKIRASEWLERRDRADWNEADQAELDAWLAASHANLIAYWRVHDAWRRAERLVALRPLESDSTARVSGARLRSVLVRVAVAVTIVALGVGASLFLTGSREQIYKTPVGGRQTVTLADGSRIELNTDSVLRADIGADHRTASLDKGEAYFNIAHDTKHPFVVTAGDRRITVLGTKFLVRQDTNRLEVALMEGRVWLGEASDKTRAQSTLLVPGDVAVATAATITLTKQPPHRLSDDLAWRRGMLVFFHTPLVQAANELNRYNRRQIVIADRDASRLTMNGSFPATDIAAFAEAAREVFGLHVEDRGDNVVISR
jgi:transmembrane sensor